MPDPQMTLEERVAALEYLVRVIARQIADPPGTSRPTSDPGSLRIVRTSMTRHEARADVQRLLDRLGFSDISFEVR